MKTPHRPLSAAVILVALGVLAPGPARAHFILQAPPASTSQDFLGSPQKLGPCGGEPTSPPATSTGKVTTYQEGQTITVTVDGTIPHSGHWRVSLGLDGPSSLPPEPAVTAGSTACGSAAIEDPPVFPVLADNLLPSTSGFTGVQSMQITLPAGVTCTKCTLQVMQFMSNHPLNNPGGCFYHHCADISIVGAGQGTGGSTGAGGGTTGPGTGPTAASGCSYAVPASTSPLLLGLGSLVALAALLRGRRRR